MRRQVTRCSAHAAALLIAPIVIRPGHVMWPCPWPTVEAICHSQPDAGRTPQAEKQALFGLDTDLKPAECMSSGSMAHSIRARSPTICSRMAARATAPPSTHRRHAPPGRVTGHRSDHSVVGSKAATWLNSRQPCHLHVTCKGYGRPACNHQQCSALSTSTSGPPSSRMDSQALPQPL